MTIASTGNRIADDLARASARNQKKEAAAKAKAARAAKASGRMSKVSAGRNAIKAGATRGKGIAIKTQKSGTDFGGLLSYGLDKPQAQIISSNCGFDKPSILKDMERCAEQKKIKSPVGHIIFSLPPSTQIGDAKWREIIDFARREIGLDDSFSFISILHRDADHAHIHLIYSRVSDCGEVFNDYRLGLRLAYIEDLIEDMFALPLVPVNRDRPSVNYKKGEIEKAIKAGQQPDRMQLNQIVMRASAGRPSVLAFIAACAASGVVVRPNVATTGKLNGFSFSMLDSSVEFKGSQIGASWSQLQKMGVSYDQTTEFETLADHVQQLEAGTRSSDEVESTSASVGILGEEVKESKPSASPTDQSTQSAGQDALTASPDPVRPSITTTTHRPLARVQTTPAAADQIEPPDLGREEFQALLRALIDSKGSTEARAQAAAAVMNWNQQRELKQTIANIDAWHKRMGNAETLQIQHPQGDQHLSSPTM